MRFTLATLFFSVSLLGQTTGGVNIVAGKVDLSSAVHTAPAIVVSSADLLPTTGCTVGELAMVSGAILGQQLYENSGSGTCVWTQQQAGGSTPFFDQILSGCGVQYVSGLTFTVGTPCNYVIAGVDYSIASNTSLTLTAADPSQDRIDVIAVDNAAPPGGEAIVITGTPGTPPAEPSVDPSTQIGLVFVYVAATAMTPSNFTTLTIYDENTEWTCTPSANLNCASTNNPFHLTKDIEATNAVRTNNVTLVDPAAGTVNLSNYNVLNFWLRSKAKWPTGNGSGANAARSLNVFWSNASGQIGSAVNIKDGTFGFSSSNTTGYQLISIPVADFGTANVLLTTLEFQIAGTSGTSSIGFYIDWVQLQAGQNIVLPTTIMNWRGTYSATTSYNPNDTVVSGGIGYVALLPNTNVAVTTASTWAPLSSPVKNYSQSFSSVTSVALTHNLNTTNVITACYDNASPANQITPSNVAITNANTVTVSFSASQSGSCVVNAIGGTGPGGATPNQTVRQLGAFFDGGGSALTAQTNCTIIDFAATITGVTLLADFSGSATVDIQTVAYSSYTGPASASSITASDTPALSSAIKAQDTALTGWTTALVANTVVCFKLTAPSTVTKLNADLKLSAN